MRITLVIEDVPALILAAARSLRRISTADVPPSHDVLDAARTTLARLLADAIERHGTFDQIELAEETSG